MINKIYRLQNTDSLAKIFKANKKLPSIRMPKIFEEHFFLNIQNEIDKIKFKKNEQLMEARFQYALLPSLDKLLNSKECLQLFSFIIRKKILKCSGKLYSFGWKDYTLLHDEMMEKPGYDVIVDLSAWDDACGGYVTYSDGMGDSNKLSSSPNTLTLAFRGKKMQKYIKYVNNKAGKKKRYLYMGKLF